MIDSEILQCMVLDGKNFQSWKQHKILNLSILGQEKLIEGINDSSVNGDNPSLTVDRKIQFKILNMLHSSMTEEVRQRLPEPDSPVSNYWRSIINYFETQCEHNSDKTVDGWMNIEYDNLIDFEIIFYILRKFENLKAPKTVAEQFNRLKRSIIVTHIHLLDTHLLYLIDSGKYDPINKKN